ncbi:MAG: TauD/TfdA family dioxygenase [Micropepsaceae bacterium]
MQIEALNGCGALIGGIDLAQASDAEVAAVRQAAFEHGVAFLHGQDLHPEAHIAFARRVGPIVINRYFPKTERFPEIAKVEKTEEQTTNIGGGWHTDHSYDAEPAMGSILVAMETPPAGGDTLFASMYAAWDALSDGLKATLSGLRAVHSAAHIFGGGAAYKDTDQKSLSGHTDLPESVHPVAITHPGSGKKALYVNPTFTLRFEGWTAEESKPLLDYLYAHAQQPQFVHRFSWKPGSVAFWDNRATWHNAMNDYHGHRRLMHRITIAGQRLD